MLDKLYTWGFSVCPTELLLKKRQDYIDKTNNDPQGISEWIKRVDEINKELEKRGYKPNGSNS